MSRPPTNQKQDQVSKLLLDNTDFNIKRIGNLGFWRLRSSIANILANTGAGLGLAK